jgi:hypothetical protein
MEIDMKKFYLKKKFILYSVILASTTLTNTAFSQGKCELTHTIKKGKWQQISIPCDPGSENTLSQVIGDDIQGKLGTDWAVFKYSQNHYIPLSADDSVKPGEGYWIIYTKGEPTAELDMPNTATEVNADDLTVSLPSRANENSWHMIGLPSIKSRALDELKITTDTSSCSVAGCSLTQANSGDIVHNKIWTYKEEQSRYATLEGVDKLTPWTGGWVASLKQAHNSGTPRLIFPANTHPFGDYADLEDKENWSNNPAGITHGFGSWGEFDVNHVSKTIFDSKGFIDVYHPASDTPRKYKTVFFLSGYRQKTDSYEKYLRFIASHGYTVVNVSYDLEPADPNDWKMDENYFALYGMLKTAHATYSHLIDTRHIGLMGHSLGGGASIWLGKKLFGEDNWGNQGRFIFSTAPWYTFNTTEDDLKNFPDNTKLLIQVGDNERDPFGSPKRGMDERAIRAVYELINIDDSDKDYIRVVSGNGYDADHFISQTKSTKDFIGRDVGGYDKYDAFAMNRITHAMLDYVFEKNNDAKKVALGNGHDKQISMDGLPNLVVTDTPIITHDKSEYVYTCSATAAPWGSYWKLADDRYCNDSDGDGIIDALD